MLFFLPSSPFSCWHVVWFELLYQLVSKHVRCHFYSGLSGCAARGTPSPSLCSVGGRPGTRRCARASSLVEVGCPPWRCWQSSVSPTGWPRKHVQNTGAEMLFGSLKILISLRFWTTKVPPNWNLRCWVDPLLQDVRLHTILLQKNDEKCSDWK